MADDMDICEEILVRLEVEDVIRCKSVCKSWYFLISTDYFVKAHLKHSYNNSHKLGHLRIQLRRDIHKSIDLSSRMVGSSNGLVCISPDGVEILVANPSTREVNKLPPHPYEDTRKICWGFGYDSSTDDYKVVVGFNESDRHMRFQVLTLKSNKWEFIGDNDKNFAYNFSHFGYGLLYNGALHWFLDDVKKKKKTVILSFDLTLHIFKEIPQPDDAEYLFDNRNILGTFEECLCISRRCNDCFLYACTHLRIWVMKNYNSWQPLPRDYEGYKYVDATSACKLGCDPYNIWRLCVDDKGNIDLSLKRWCNIACPIFVKSLVSPYGQYKEEGTQEKRVFLMGGKPYLYSAIAKSEGKVGLVYLPAGQGLSGAANKVSSGAAVQGLSGAADQGLNETTNKFSAAADKLSVAADKLAAAVEKMEEAMAKWRWGRNCKMARKEKLQAA